MISITRPACPNPAALGRGNYKHADNKAALKQASADKCMYCESKCSHTYYGDVEHIEPRSKVPAKEFLWENLGFSCAICNGSKNDYHNPTLPLLNPYHEDPSVHLRADGAIIYPRFASERGRISTITLKLNRPQLVSRRLEKLRTIESLVNSILLETNMQLKAKWLADLQILAGVDEEYSMVVGEASQRIQTLTL